MKFELTVRAVLLAVVMTAAEAQSPQAERDAVANGRRLGTPLNPNNAPLDPLGLAGNARPKSGGGNGIDYRNGPVMTAAVNVYPKPGSRDSADRPKPLN